MKQNGVLNTDKVQQESAFPKETLVIQMNHKEHTPLQVAMAKVNGAIVNGKEHSQQNQLAQINIRRSSRLRL